VVGIGALNLDYLVAGAAPVLPPLEWGAEQGVDAATIRAVLDATEGRPSLGGSAFNTVYAMAHAGAGLRLGYVGVAGRMPVPGLSALDTLDACGIDRRHVFRDDEHLCGTCVSILRDGDRTLLTHAGANAAFADHLDAGFDGLVSYLARARLVHVTSFLDDRTPGRLLAVLTAVRAASPGTLICVDPGHVWSTRPTTDIGGILRLADYALVNEREFRGPAGDATVVVKHARGIRWYSGRELAGVRRQVPLPAAEIVDATGAGDVFAAGLLIELAAGEAGIGPGCELGLLLARHKLRHLGSAGHAGFARLVAAFRAAGAAPSGAGPGAAPSAADAAAPAPRPDRPCP